MKTLLFVILLVSVLAVPAFAHDDYPFTAIDVPDPWGFLTRESTSYAAWHLNTVTGWNWYNTQPGRGNARYWDEIAYTLDYTISSIPQVGAAISWKGPMYAGDQWGHVAIVEAINSNSTIDVSEYNWVSYSYSYRSNVNPSSYGRYVYIYQSVPEPSSLIGFGTLLTSFIAFCRWRK